MSFTYEVYPFNIAGNTTPFNYVAFNKDSDLCICAPRSGIAYLFSTDNWTILGNYQYGSAGSIIKANFSADSRFVYLLTNLSLNIFETVTGRCLLSVNLPKDIMLSAGVEADNDFKRFSFAYRCMKKTWFICTISLDVESALKSNETIILDSEDCGLEKFVIDYAQGEVDLLDPVFVASSNFERFYFAKSTTHSKSITLYNSGLEVCESYELDNCSIVTIKLQRNEGVLSASLDNGCVILLDALTLEQFFEGKTHARYVSGVSVHPNADFFAVGGGIKAIDAARVGAVEGEYNVGIFDIEGRDLAFLTGATSTIVEVAWSEDGCHLCAVTYEGVVLAWNFPKSVNNWKMEIN